MRLAIPTVILAVVLVLGWRVCSGGERDHLQLTEADLPAELREGFPSDPPADAPPSDDAAGDGVAAAGPAEGTSGALPVDLPRAAPGASPQPPPAAPEAPEVAALRATPEASPTAAPDPAPLPAVSAPEPPAEPPGAGGAGRVYVVQPGDWLMQIAREQFGDASRAAEIARLNGLSDADTLKPGQELRLP